MPCFNVLISEKSLRTALIEQLRSLKDNHVVELNAITQHTGDGACLILDDTALDKKTLKALSELQKDNKHPLVFLIGELDATDNQLFTEIFRRPLRLGHFLGRVGTHLEIAQRLKNVPLTFGPYRLETYNRQIIYLPNNEIIRLTEKETALLEYLGQSEHPVGRDELLAAIWGYDSSIETHTLETHIYQLRRKLDPSHTGENWLLNEQGAYRLNRIREV